MTKLFNSYNELYVHEDNRLRLSKFSKLTSRMKSFLTNKSLFFFNLTSF